MAYEDAEKFEFFGMGFECTRTQCNALIIEVSDTPQYKEWSVLDSLLEKMTCSPDNYAKIEDMVARLEDLRRQLVRITHKKILAFL